MFGGFGNMPGMGGMGGGDPNQQQQQGGMPGMGMGMMGGGGGMMPGMGGMGMGMQQQPPQGQQQQQQGGNNMMMMGGGGGMPGMDMGMMGGGGGMGGGMGMMMGGMGGGQQQPQQQQQQGGGMGMMGGMNPMAMMGGMGMGGSGGGQQPDPNDHGAFNSLFSNRQADAPVPEFLPSSAPTFKANVQIEASMMPGMVMKGVQLYELPKSRQRVDWGQEYGPENAGWEIENHLLGWKVRKEGGQDPKPTEIDSAKDQFPQYTVPPFAQFQGYESISGKNCYRYYFDFMGLMSGTLWVSIPVAPTEGASAEDDSGKGGLAAVSVPVFAQIFMPMMGMTTRMYFSEHELVEGFEDSLFDISQYCPPKGPKGIVAGYARDSTNNRSIAGVTVQFTPANGLATTDAMTATTNDQGRFQVEIPGCEYNVAFAKEGYVNFTKNLTVDGPIPAGTAADAYLSPILEEPQLRFVLRWQSSPRDLDFHARTDSNGAICHYASRNHPLARLQCDITTGYGPETIFVPNSSPDEAVNIFVYQYSSGGSLVGCGATVDVYDHTGHAHNIVVPSEGTGRWWKVARVEGGAVEIFNTVS